MTEFEAKRPLLRGYLHLAAAIVSPAALVVLVLSADEASAYVAAAIFGAALILLYSTSASYHLLYPRERLRTVLNRADHSMIFVFIAASYTPFYLTVFGRGWGISLLAVTWVLAGLGVALKLFWPTVPRWLGVTLYMGLGWIGLVAAVPAWDLLSTQAVILVALGGAMYSVGAVVYARKSPDPWPRYFGYHEVFHALVIVASVLFYVVVLTEVVT